MVGRPVVGVVLSEVFGLATAATSKIKIFQVAKEVGVDSKVVVAKLIAEGIPGADAMNYQSTIPVGLAVTIKEWFSTDASLPHTAVETGQKVDIERAKATKRPSRAKAKTKDDATKPEGDAEAAPAAVSPVEVKPPAESPKPAPKQNRLPQAIQSGTRLHGCFPKSTTDCSAPNSLTSINCRLGLRSIRSPTARRPEMTLRGLATGQAPALPNWSFALQLEQIVDVSTLWSANNRSRSVRADCRA